MLPKNIEESIEIVREFNQKNRYRDTGRINTAIDNILNELESMFLEEKDLHKTIKDILKELLGDEK